MSSKANRDPEQFITELDKVRQAAADLIKQKRSSADTSKDMTKGVCIQDFFPLGDLSYYDAVHMKLTRLLSLSMSEEADPGKMSNLIYDAINYLTFWGADVHLRMREVEHRPTIGRPDNARELYDMGYNPFSQKPYKTKHQVDLEEDRSKQGNI